MAKAKKTGIVETIINKLKPKFKSELPEEKKYVSIHFTLKGTIWKDIQKALHEFRDSLPENVILINAFMSLKAINNHGFDPKVRILLNTLFPEQENFWIDETQKCDRDSMIQFMKGKDCVCFFIKPIIEGVQEEYDLVYEQLGPDVILSYPSES